MFSSLIVFHLSKRVNYSLPLFQFSSDKLVFLKFPEIFTKFPVVRSFLEILDALFYW